MRILVVNAGSSSLKLRLLGDTDEVLASADLPADASGVDADAVTAAVHGWPVPDAIGHRVVHGGTRFTGPVLVDAAVRAQLDELTTLAPLHQPKSLTALDAVSAVYPDMPAVACFDTAFHATLPDAASTYPVPREWRSRYGVRRYGFHGLSHAYCSARAHSPSVITAPAQANAHLGAAEEPLSLRTQPCASAPLPHGADSSMAHACCSGRRETGARGRSCERRQ